MTSADPVTRNIATRIFNADSYFTHDPVSTSYVVGDAILSMTIGRAVCVAEGDPGTHTGFIFLRLHGITNPRRTDG